MRSRFLAALVMLTLAPSAGALDHSGDVSGTWRAADSPHRVVGTARVPAGELLDIEPGSLVAFVDGTRLAVDGTLRAAGTLAAPVVFASAGPGRPGAWKGLVLVGAGPHVLSFVDVSSAVTGFEVGPGATLDLRDSSVFGALGDGISFRGGSFGLVERCTVHDCGASGISVLDASPVLRDTRLGGSARAVFVSGDAFPVMSGLVATGHAEGDGILVDTLAPVTGTGTWRDGGVPWIVPRGTLQVGANAVLSVAPGTIVKLGAGAGVLVEGQLSTTGTPGTPCTFTSLHDDGAGGDTNGNGAATAPDKGDWDSLEVAPGGLLRLRGAAVRHADDGVRVLGGTCILYDCDVRDAAWRGAAFGPLGSGIVYGTSFTDCDTGLQVADASAVAAGLPGGGPGAGGRNAFTCNVSFDVQNLGETPLALHESWFGPAGADPSRLDGIVDLGAPLAFAPERVEGRRPLRVTKPAAGMLRVGWDDAGSCSSYRLGAGAAPDQPFGLLARTTATTWSGGDADVPAGRLAFFVMSLE